MGPQSTEERLPTKSMLAALWQLKQFVLPYKAGLFTGIGAFGVARLFEVMVPAGTMTSNSRATPNAPIPVNKPAL